MADYREISQQYAQGAINAAILVNGGAAVVLLSQVPALGGISGSIRFALVAWAVGVLGGALTWVLGFISTRFVDKSERENDLKAQHLRTSDRFMTAGLIAVAASLGCFALAVIVLAICFPSNIAQH